MISIKLINRPNKAIPVTVVFLLLFLAYVPVSFAYENYTVDRGGIKEYARYSASNGFQVISYSKSWSTTAQLRELYQELLQNMHGEEMSLLTKLYIYPGRAPDGENVAGHWFGAWKIEQGKYRLLPNRYINLYFGDTIKDSLGYSRTLAHEYGHHFTYYYYLKKENKSWDKWRSTEFAQARGVANNPFIGSSDATIHAWQIEEIAANDYVQLFGSKNARRSYSFMDIEGRARSGQLDFTFSNQVFNLAPQENPLLGLAANSISTRDYWMKAMARPSNEKNLPPTPSKLRLEAVNDIGAEAMQYVFSWTEGQDEYSSDLEYTLVRYAYSPITGDFRQAPIKTVYRGTELRALYGAVLAGNTYYWDVIPSGIQLFTVYTKDREGLTVASNSVAIDFRNPLKPANITLTVEEMDRGAYFRPRVKVNDEQLSFDVEPEIVKGTTIVPFRAIFDKLGAEVIWDEQTNSITAVKDDISVYLIIGENMAYINGLPVELPIPAQIKNKRALVPLRLVSEAFGATVGWNEQLQLISLETKD